MQDAVEVARALGGTRQEQEGVGSRAAWRAVTTPALTDALRAFEKKRSKRIFPLAARSWGMGTALQLPYPPVGPAFLARHHLTPCCLPPDLHLPSSSIPFII